MTTEAPKTREALADALSKLRVALNGTHNLNYLRATGRGEDAYVALIHRLAWAGTPKPSRSGGWTLGLVGEQFRCSLREGFPILFGKRVFWKGVVAELLWFLNGETNVQVLQAQGVHIWDEWARPDGELGPIYGAQWRGHRAACPKSNRTFETDQIAQLLEGLEQDPFGRRHIVTAWNPDAIHDMQLPPCHSFWQVVCHPAEDGRIAVNMVLTQRSADVFLGVPFNIASYALLAHLLVAHLNCSRSEFVVGDLVITFGDLHLYAGHIDPATQYLHQYTRLPHTRATLELPARAPEKPWGWAERVLQESLCGYTPAPAIKAEVAV